MPACRHMSASVSPPSPVTAPARKRVVLFALVFVGFAALLASLAIVEHAKVTRIPGRVLQVVDADTIEVRLAKGTVRVRLHAIDAPELDQPWGPESLRALGKMVLGKDIEFEPLEEGADGRIV